MMSELFEILAPYLGTTICVGTISLVVAFLSRRGLNLKRLKFRDAEIEFDKEEKSAVRTSGEVSARIENRLSPSVVSLTSQALEDCRSFDLPEYRVVDFLVSESASHRQLFSSPFVSIPLIFGARVCVLSWDGERAVIERVLERKEAYPLNDSWIATLSSYRIATLLPYRTQDPSRLVIRTEASRTLRIFERLVQSTRVYLQALSEEEGVVIPKATNLAALSEEAAFALEANDLGSSVSRLEAILSTVHKLLLQYVPQGVTRQGSAKTGYSETTTSRGRGLTTSGNGLRILYVEDDADQARIVLRRLEIHGYNGVSATRPLDAFRLLADMVFDFIIIDMHLAGNHDGIEVARVARAASPNSKIVMFSAYMNMAQLAVGEGATPEFRSWDYLIEKGLPEDRSFKMLMETLKSAQDAVAPNPAAPADQKAPLSDR